MPEIEGLSFIDEVAPHVERLLAEVKRTYPNSVYRTKKDIRAAVHPHPTPSKALGVFLRIAPRKTGAVVQLDKVKFPSTPLAEETLEVILKALPEWMAAAKLITRRRK